jgi:phenylpyruvate tautomerase PptA (4-oxalocrotonate tautomerase family)
LTAPVIAFKLHGQLEATTTRSATMPMLELTYPEGALRAGARSSLVEDLGETLLRWEGAPDTEFFRQVTWVYLDERPAWAINRAGAPAEPPVFRLAVTVPSGALSERRKAGFVEEATKLVLEAEGGDGDSQRVWVHIHEIPDGNWGALGQVIRFEQLREAARQEREQATTA